ncbi:uncharacterized protein EI90DRAFT_3154075 [Cantharellus anzutake]|uniref:uncharacterized protein n=1 Tax=Cantharellus anzutake TaxID=1750568 RepID=UPI001907DE0F|nr:uncharacterized protein EI90DRAFT_3154075 [Cantharellus anzutake]KAF8332740.1 hypothetical protein EI90DRAFT_3154075 [Cantharellus anzutake]
MSLPALELTPLRVWPMLLTMLTSDWPSCKTVWSPCGDSDNLRMVDVIYSNNKDVCPPKTWENQVLQCIRAKGMKVMVLYCSHGAEHITLGKVAHVETLVKEGLTIGGHLYDVVKKECIQLQGPYALAIKGVSKYPTLHNHFDRALHRRFRMDFLGSHLGLKSKDVYVFYLSNWALTAELLNQPAFLINVLVPKISLIKLLYEFNKSNLFIRHSDMVGSDALVLSNACISKVSNDIIQLAEMVKETHEDARNTVKALAERMLSQDRSIAMLESTVAENTKTNQILATSCLGLTLTEIEQELNALKEKRRRVNDKIAQKNEDNAAILNSALSAMVPCTDVSALSSSSRIPAPDSDASNG